MVYTPVDSLQHFGRMVARLAQFCRELMSSLIAVPSTFGSIKMLGLHPVKSLTWCNPPVYGWTLLLTYLAMIVLVSA